MKNILTGKNHEKCRDADNNRVEMYIGFSNPEKMQWAFKIWHEVKKNRNGYTVRTYFHFLFSNGASIATATSSIGYTYGKRESNMRQFFMADDVREALKKMYDIDIPSDDEFPNYLEDSIWRKWFEDKGIQILCI